MQRTVHTIRAHKHTCEHIPFPSARARTVFKEGLSPVDRRSLAYFSRGARALGRPEPLWLSGGSGGARELVSRYCARMGFCGFQCAQVHHARVLWVAFDGDLWASECVRIALKIVSHVCGCDIVRPVRGVLETIL